MRRITRIFSFLAVIIHTSVSAQTYAEYEPDSYSVEQDVLAKNSVRPVTQSDRMWAEGQWVRIDLREKQNEPMRAAGNEFVRLLIEATKIGAIKPFTNDSMNTRMSVNQFNDKMIIPNSGSGLDELEWLETDDPWITEGEGIDEGETDAETESSLETWRINDLYMVDVKVNKIFDRKHSRMVNDVQSIRLFVPAEMSPKAVELDLGTYSYKELKRNLFEKNPEAIWFNRDNISEHRNLSDAFDLWLMATSLQKVTNPRDEEFANQYGETEQKLVAASKHITKILEYEQNAWSQ